MTYMWRVARAATLRHVRFRASYHNAASLLRDHEQQFARGGLLVRVEPLPEVELFEAVELELATPYGVVVIEVQVIQMLPGMGVAVGFTADSASGLTSLLDAARADRMPGTADPATFKVVGGARAPRPVDARTRLKNATTAEKMQIALHGTKEERGLILRDGNRLLHQYVVRNPKIQLDEIAHVAGLRTMAPELLAFIASRREWAQRPEVALALVRNPKTPVPLAVKLVDHVPMQHLRQLAKAGAAKAPIQKAARKKVLR